MPAFLSSGLSKKKTLKKTDNLVFLSELKQTRRKRSVCRKEGSFAPFLPPSFMRGEGHEVAGGVLLRSGESLLSHGFAVPAPPEGKPRVLRTVLAPRIYEGGGPRSGRGSSPPQRGQPSQSRFTCRLSQGRDRRDSSCFPIPFNGEIATVFRQSERNGRKPAPLCGHRGTAYFARSSRISRLSQAPTVLAVTLPPFMTTSVGMLATWNSMARSMA